MKRLFFLIAHFILSTPFLFAQQWVATGSRVVGMGYASVANTDFWSVNNNQAAMAFYAQNSAGIYYENRFMIKELSYQSLALCYTTKFGMLGANMNYSGNSNYNNIKAGLGYALRVGQNFAFGVQLDYLRIGFADIYKGINKVTFEIGLLYKLSDNLAFGIHTYNPLPIKLAEYADERIPTIVNAGFAYNITQAIVVNTEIYKHSLFPLDIRTGAEYKVNNIFAARIGLAVKPFRYTFGFGVELKNFNFDFSSSMHQTLGYSPQLSMHYSF